MAGLARVRLLAVDGAGRDRWPRASGISLGPAGEIPMTVQSRECRDVVRFAPVVILTKGEAFEACQVCADVERALFRAGRPVEAARAASLFEILESRLVAP